MKVYLLFCGENYYPAGFNDYKGTFKDYDSAFNFVLNECKNSNYDWAEIIEVTETESKLVFDQNIESFFKGFNNGNLER